MIGLSETGNERARAREGGGGDTVGERVCVRVCFLQNEYAKTLNKLLANFPGLLDWIAQVKIRRNPPRCKIVFSNTPVRCVIRNSVQRCIYASFPRVTTFCILPRVTARCFRRTGSWWRGSRPLSRTTRRTRGSTTT